jgi:hypothetical protein
VVKTESDLAVRARVAWKHGFPISLTVLQVRILAVFLYLFQEKIMNAVTQENPLVVAAFASLQVGVEFETFHPLGLDVVYPNIARHMICKSEFSPKPGMNINGLGVWGIGYDFSIAPKELRGADTEKKFGIEFRSPVYGVTGDDVRDYGFDYTTLLDGDTIASSSWSASGVTVASSSNTTTETAVRITGGSLGTKNKVKNTVITVGGQTIVRRLIVVIQEM